MKRIFLLEPRHLNDKTWLLSTDKVPTIVIADSELNARISAANDLHHAIESYPGDVKNDSPWMQGSLVTCKQIAEACIDLQDSIFTLYIIGESK